MNQISFGRSLSWQRPVPGLPLRLGEKELPFARLQPSLSFAPNGGLKRELLIFAADHRPKPTLY